MADDPTNQPLSPLAMPPGATGPLPQGLFSGAPQMPAQGFNDTDIDRALKMQLLSQSLQAQQDFAKTRAQQESDTQEMKAKEAQQQNLHLGFQPHWHHGEGIGGLFKNIGEGLLTGLASTGPGQAFQNVAYSGQRQQYGTLAEQIRDIQERMGIRAKELEPEAQLGYRTPYGYSQVSRAGTEAKRAATQEERTRAQTAIEQARNELTKRGQDINQAIATKKMTVEQARTEMSRIVAEINAKAHTDVAGIMSDTQEHDQYMRSSDAALKEEYDHLLAGWMGIRPPKPVTPAAQPPASSNKPNAKSATPNKSATKEVTATGPNGHKIAYRGGKWVDAQSGKPIQ